MAETNRIMDHEYDGIQEYDNPTPGWWHGIFFATVLFACAYFVFWQMNPEAPTIQSILAADQIADLRRQFAGLGELKPDEPTMLRMMGDPKWLSVGESVFRSNCVSCHGANAGGVVGPNLTDDSWKNVKKLEDIPRVIASGAANGAMPTWKGRLHPNEIVLVASYIATLRGKNAPGRPPEGEVIPAWPPVPPPAPEKPAEAGAHASKP